MRRGGKSDRIGRSRGHVVIVEGRIRLAGNLICVCGRVDAGKIKYSDNTAAIGRVVRGNGDQRLSQIVEIIDLAGQRTAQGRQHEPITMRGDEGNVACGNGGWAFTSHGIDLYLSTPARTLVWIIVHHVAVSHSQANVPRSEQETKCLVQCVVPTR